MFNFMKSKNQNDFNLVFYYATYDRASNCFSDMFPARSDMEARRMVAQVVNTPQTLFNLNQKDLELVCKCSMNVRTGFVNVIDNKICNLDILFDSKVYEENVRLKELYFKSVKEKENG